MIAKERLIFFPLLAVFLGILIVGLTSQEKNKEAALELLKEVERATKKAKVKSHIDKKSWDTRVIKKEDSLENYSSLLKRSPFFRISTEVKKETPSIEPVKLEPEKKVLLVYKGRVVMDERVMVVIEDKGTGKSFFVQEGDMIGDFLVYSIDSKKIVLKKKGGEEIVLSVAKKEKEQDHEKK